MNTSILVVGGIFSAAVFWILPIVLGIRIARKKNRSPHWMWTAMYPVLAWIPYFVIRSLPALKTCEHCGEKAKSFARVCPHCRNAFDSSGIGSGSQAPVQQ